MTGERGGNGEPSGNPGPGNELRNLTEIPDAAQVTISDVDEGKKAGTRSEVTLALRIDTSISPVMEYFEIFLTRMVMCRRSAELLGYKFALSVNGTYLE